MGGGQAVSNTNRFKAMGTRKKMKIGRYTFFDHVVARLDRGGVEWWREGMWPGLSEDLAKFHTTPST